jgi:hypothetical protein
MLRGMRVPMRAWLLLLAGGALSSCTSLSHHTAAPYDRDPAQAAAIEAEAAQWCAEHGQPGGPPSVPFRFDGCSWWPDGDYRDCCQLHDYAYWCGGPAGARSAADESLRSCVAEKRGGAYARLMWLGVRVGGHPLVPLYFRWGYGHPYAGGYPDAPAPDARGR